MTDSKKEDSKEKKSFPKKTKPRYNTTKETQGKSKNSTYKKTNKFEKKDKFDKTEKKIAHKNKDFKKNFTKEENRGNTKRSRGFGNKNGNFKKNFVNKEEGNNNQRNRGFGNKNGNFKKNFVNKEEGNNNQRNRGFGNKNGNFKKNFVNKEEGNNNQRNRGFGNKNGNFKKNFTKEGDRNKTERNKDFRNKNGNFKKNFTKEGDRNNTEKNRGFRNKNGNFKKNFVNKEEGNNTQRNRRFGSKRFADTKNKNFNKNQGEKPAYFENRDNPRFKSKNFKKKKTQDYEEKRFKEQKQIDKKYRRPSENAIKQIDEKKFRNKKQKAQKGAETTRLNKYIANAGICSRREADTLISQGKITVNDKVITEMGYQVKKDEVVKYGKTTLRKEPLVYVLLNKPKDYITTTDDPQERKIVMDLVENACQERIYPVGRLDRNTTGLLLFTNDGDLAKKISHPSGNISKIYEIGLDKPLTNNDAQQIIEGLILEDGFIQVDDLVILTSDNLSIGLELHSGKNRIVRRIFEHLGYEVLKLDRTSYAGLNKKDLPRGNWRFLSEKEIIRLKYFI